MQTSDFLVKHKFSADIDFDVLLAEFDRQMTAGLEGRPSSLAMIPSYVSLGKSVPANTPIIVLDAGGTNLRVAVIHFNEAGEAKFDCKEKFAMPGTTGETLAAAEFYAKFADFLEPVAKRSPSVGFCFSYPTEITPTLDGRLIRWTKQVAAPEVVGQMIGAGIADALEKKTGIRLTVKILNDTVATLLAGAGAGMSRGYSSYCGFILGTGTNIAYVESNAKITKVAGLDRGAKMVINCETGNFDGAPQSDFDREMDARTSDPGKGLFEKMISGAYIGGVGLALLKTAARDGIFSAPAAEALLAFKALSTKDFDDFVANPFLRFSALSDIPFTDDDRRAVMELGEPVFVRAANLTAANIAAAVLKSGAGTDKLHPVCVTVDGSTYYKTRTAFFKSRVEEALRKILYARGVYFEIISVEDAPMIGSAVAGLIS
ncbi:MAG: hexokinase [Kiritimatiellaeota bacterium]|nr:hexokinase [Kiritimatiellota bacterium]